LGIFYEKQLEEDSISEGSKTLSLREIYSTDFDLPKYPVQQTLMERLKPLLDRREKGSDLLQRISAIKDRILSSNYSVFQAKDVPIWDVLDCLSGNSGLTEEYLYSQLQAVAERKYRILTASTDPAIKYTHRCKHPKDSVKLIAVTEGKPVIQIIRIGKAGSVTFFDKGNYTITENAYLLFLKDNLKYALDLKWVMYALIPQFNEYANVAEYGTWNKTGFFRNARIDIPSYTEQVEVAKAYGHLEELEKKIRNYNAKIEDLFAKQVVSISNP